MTTSTKPHYLLFCEGSAGPRFGFPQDDASRWRFVLENVESGHKIEAWDYEEILHPDRISLMAVIRGLEALDQPSKVTLVTTNRYVARGLQYGLSEWRENDFCWEHFGSIQPIRNQDLWRRVDVALRYHEVTCRWMAYDSQQDRIDGDRRDVPVETQASRGSQPIDQEKYDVSPRVRSRSYTAVSNFLRERLQDRLEPSNPASVGETLVHCAVSNGTIAPILDRCDFEPTSTEESAEDMQSVNPFRPKRSIVFTSLLSCMWRFVLRIDTMLVYALRTLLLLDPKPDSYRIRR